MLFSHSRYNWTIEACKTDGKQPKKCDAGIQAVGNRAEKHLRHFIVQENSSVEVAKENNDKWELMQGNSRNGIMQWSAGTRRRQEKKTCCVGG